MSTWTKLFAVVALALGLLAAPGAALAAITISDTSSAVPWQLGTVSSGTTGADVALTGTESFSIISVPGNTVLIVNYAQFCQSSNGTGLVANTSIKWNGVPLTAAIVESSTAVNAGSSPVYAEVFYLFNPSPAVNGSLVISGSGRDAIVGAYTLSGVSASVNPTGVGAVTGGTTGIVSLNLPSTTPAGGFAAITSAFRLNGNNNIAYTTSTGPAVSNQWVLSPDFSTDMYSGSAFIPNLGGGSLTITQSNNAPSRNVIAAAVFTPGSATTPGSIWSTAGGGSWSSTSSWGGTVPSGTGAVAEFTASNPTSAAAVSLDAPVTVNVLVLANSNQISIGPGSGGSLTFASSGNNAPIVSVTAGSHIISAPVSMNTTTIFGVNSGQSLALNGGLADGTASSGISLAGGGTLILGGNNSYSGTTLMTAGTLNVTTSLGNTPIVVKGGALTVSGSVGNGSLAVSGGAVNVGGGVGGGPVTVSAGTVNVGGNVGSGPVAVTGGIVTVGGNVGSGPVAVSAGSVTVAGALLGSGSVSVTGGSLSIAGALVGSNSITVSNGVANLNVNGNSPVTLSGGALNLSGSLGNSPAISMTGGSLSLLSSNEIGQNQLAISGGTAATSLLVETASNAITGSTALSLSGNVLAILSQANNYSGTTSVTSGAVLQLGMPSSLYAGNTANWTPANISVTGSATLVVNIGGPNDFTQPQAATLLTNLSASTSSSGLEANAAFGFDATNATGTVTYSGQITDTAVGPLPISKRGTGTLVLSGTSSYSGPTVVSNGELIMTGANSAGTVGTLSAVNSIPSGLSVLSIRNVNALGSGTANSGLAPITLNATGGNNANSINDTAILEIGAKIGTDPGPYNADFSYQVVAPGNGITGTATPTNVVAGNGQINLGYLGNNNDGTGFAAYNANSLSTPRIVALYGSGSNSTTLATIREKWEFGQGGGDHLTLGSPTANNTLVLENPVDMNGGASRQFFSIRGVGIVPEGEYAGAIINSANSNLNISFNGNGGLIFDSPLTSYLNGQFQVNGGAVFVAANDPAQSGQNGSLGNGTVTFQLGTGTATNPVGGTAVPTVASANIAFMTYGPNAGIGSVGVFTNRNINVGGSDVTYASATLGGMTFDWTQMNGSISLNESPTIPTTFTARNGGRVDFGGNISGSGSVVVGNSIVEGDATSPGIAVGNNGTIVFNGAASYTGSTAVTAGQLYVNGSLNGTSLVTVGSGATLGGMGFVYAPVNVSSGGILEGGQAGLGTLTLNSSVTFNGPVSVNFGGMSAFTPSLSISTPGALNTNGNPITINLLAVSASGNYALIGSSGIQSASSSYTLSAIPGRGVATLAFNNGPNELDVDVTSVTPIVWTGTASSSWDTTTTNWSLTGGGGSTHFIDNPGDIVIFDDSASPHTTVTINGADVHPSSVTFDNNNSTYTISGSNGIAGGTGMQLTGTGTVILLNANTFNGVTSIGAGATLQMGNGSAGNDGSITQSRSITDNGALIYKLSGSQAYGGEISGAGFLTLQSGMLALTGSSSYSGDTTINSGTLQLGVGAVNRDGNLVSNITNNGALVFNYFGPQTYASVISGSGPVTKSGAGTLTLGSNNTFTGATQVNLGGLQLANQFALQNSPLTIGPFGSLSFAGGVTDFNLVGLAGAGNISLTDSLAGAVVLSVGGTGPNATFSGTISGLGSLILPGSNSLTLSGTNTFGGGVTVSGGTLAITNANSLGAVGGALSLGAATLEVAGNVASARNVNFTDPASTIQVDASQTYNNTGTLTGSNLTKTGPGLLILAGTTNNSLTTAVSGGTLLANGPFMSLGTVTVSASSVFGGNASARRHHALEQGND